MGAGERDDREYQREGAKRAGQPGVVARSRRLVALGLRR
jgi:hypothetical protein